MLFGKARKRRKDAEALLIKVIEEQFLISVIAEGVTDRLNKWVDTPYAEHITPQQDIERIALEIADYAVWKTSKNR